MEGRKVKCVFCEQVEAERELEKDIVMCVLLLFKTLSVKYEFKKKHWVSKMFQSF